MYLMKQRGTDYRVWCLAQDVREVELSLCGAQRYTGGTIFKSINFQMPTVLVCGPCLEIALKDRRSIG